MGGGKREREPVPTPHRSEIAKALDRLRVLQQRGEADQVRGLVPVELGLARRVQKGVQFAQRAEARSRYIRSTSSVSTRWTKASFRVLS